MYFIEHFLELAQREGHNDYVGMLQRDIIRVVDAVAPESGQGAANVKVVRRVLQGLQQKGFLEAQAVTEIEEVLKERETDLLSPDNGGEGGGGADGDGSGSGMGGDVMDLDGQPPSQMIPPRRQNGRGGGSGGTDHGGAGDGSGGGGGESAVEPPRRLDKRQIEERIEEDRERHKRLRESIWAVPKGQDAEMWRLWEETSDLGEDDHLMGEEEQAERERAVMASCAHRTEAVLSSNGRAA